MSDIIIATKEGAMSNFVEDIAKLIEEGKSANEVIKKVLEGRKLTDMSFTGKNKFNLNTLSNLFLIDGCVADLQKDIERKRKAGTVDGSKKISEINARVSEQVKKLKTPNRIGYELSAIINRDGCPELEEKIYDAVAQDDTDENLLKMLQNFNKLSVLDDYLESRGIEVPTEDAPVVQQFLARSLAYFNDRIEGVYQTNKNSSKKEEFHPLAPVMATVILTRNMQSTFADKKLNSIGDSIENYLESYMYALMERDRVGKKSVDTDKVVLEAEYLVNKLLSTQLKETKKSGEYLHDINLYGKLMETTNNADQLSSGIDKDSTSPLSYVKRNGFIESIFGEGDNVQFTPAEEGETINNRRYFASGDKNKIYSALKCIQGKIAGVEVDPQTGKMNSMFVNPDKNFEFAVYGILYTHYSGLYMENPDLSKALVEGFADVYGETIGLKSEEEVKAVVKNAKQSLMEDLFELGDFGDLSTKEGFQFAALMSTAIEKDDEVSEVVNADEKVKPLLGESLNDLITQMVKARNSWTFVNQPTLPEKRTREQEKQEFLAARGKNVTKVTKAGAQTTQPVEGGAQGEQRVIKDSETVVEKPEEGGSIVVFGPSKSKPTIKTEDDIALAYRKGLKTPKKDIPGCWFTFVDTVSEIATQMAHPDDENTSETKAHTSTLASILTDRDIKKRRKMIFEMLETGKLDEEKYASTYEKFKKDCLPAVKVLEEVIAKAQETQQILVSGKPVPQITVEETDEEFKAQKNARNKFIKALEKEAVELSQNDGKELAQRAVAGEFGMITAKKKTSARKKTAEENTNNQTPPESGNKDGEAE